MTEPLPNQTSTSSRLQKTITPVPGPSDSLDASPEFAAAPGGVRWWLVAITAAAIFLPILLSLFDGLVVSKEDLFVAGCLVLASVCNVELGRLLDRAAREQQRPHKGLSAWAIAAVILLPSWYLVPVLALTFTHAWLRDRHIPIWKWVGAASYMTLAAMAAQGFLRLAPFDISMDSPFSGGGVAMVIAACLIFQAVESSLLVLFAVLNGPNTEIWLRRTLADPLFFATEFGVLTLGATTGLVVETGGWFAVLLGPSFLLMQQAVLHRPLQERADYDSKTGVLQFRSWQRAAKDAVALQVLDQRPWAVLFADLDRFHAFNETHGHLGGDTALAQTATALRSAVGGSGIVGRFGGEEFCILITDVSATAALENAEKIRLAIAQLRAPFVAEPITISIGVCAIPGYRGDISVSEAISLADGALYTAKQAGRNACRMLEVD